MSPLQVTHRLVGRCGDGAASCRVVRLRQRQTTQVVTPDGIEVIGALRQPLRHLRLDGTHTEDAHTVPRLVHHVDPPVLHAVGIAVTRPDTQRPLWRPSHGFIVNHSLRTALEGHHAADSSCKNT